MSDYQQRTRIEMTHEDFLKEGEKRFGEETKNWRFVCPMCGTVQGFKEFNEVFSDLSKKEKLERIQSAIAHNCIGRYSDNHGGCDWSLSGLMHLQELDVVMNGIKHPSFRFADENEL